MGPEGRFNLERPLSNMKAINCTHRENCGKESVYLKVTRMGGKQVVLL